MSGVASYFERQQLRDGSPVEIRALRPNDEAGMLAAIERTDTKSLQRRFFAMKRKFSDEERNFFMKVDFNHHVALVAVAQEDGKPTIIGGGRYIVFEPRRAEMAFVVVDAWQGRGIGSLLMRHLIKIASEAGLQELTAEVLPDNTAMLKVFSKYGFVHSPHRDPQTIQLTLKLA